MQNRLPDWGDDELRSSVESILLVAGGPVTVQALAAALGISRAHATQVLADVCARSKGGIRVQLHDGSAQLVTAPENIEVIHRYLGTTKPPALSRSALETLTIVAYRQPVTRPEIEAIRGVNSDRAVQTLVARGLVEELGRRETLGRPTEYGTTFAFLEYFGFVSLDDLPPLPGDTSREAEQIDIGLRPAPTG
jgi:segregation and condensation protein B